MGSSVGCAEGRRQVAAENGQVGRSTLTRLGQREDFYGFAGGGENVVDEAVGTGVRLDEADALVEAAQRHPGRLLYAENLAYATAVQRMVALAPRVGTPTHLEVRTIQSLPTWGEFTSDAWGGGALFDLGVHPVAIALLLANSAGLGRAAVAQARRRSRRSGCPCPSRRPP